MVLSFIVFCKAGTSPKSWCACIFLCFVWYPRWQLNERKKQNGISNISATHRKANYRHFSCLVMKRELSDNITSYKHHSDEARRWRVTLTLFIRLAQILRCTHTGKCGNSFFHKLPKTVQLSLTKLNQYQLYLLGLDTWCFLPQHLKTT